MPYCKTQFLLWILQIQYDHENKQKSALENTEDRYVCGALNTYEVARLSLAFWYLVLFALFQRDNRATWVGFKILCVFFVCAFLFSLLHFFVVPLLLFWRCFRLSVPIVCVCGSCYVLDMNYTNQTCLFPDWYAFLCRFISRFAFFIDNLVSRFMLGYTNDLWPICAWLMA